MNTKVTNAMCADGQGRFDSGGLAYGDGGQPLQHLASSPKSHFGSSMHMHALNRKSATLASGVVSMSSYPAGSPLRRQISRSSVGHHNAADAAAVAAHASRHGFGWQPDAALPPQGHLRPRLPSGSLSARELSSAANRRGSENSDLTVQRSPRSLSALPSHSGACQRIGLFVRSAATSIFRIPCNGC
jgi:hypothetical protein